MAARAPPGPGHSPLPDDHKADALRFRLERRLDPVWKSRSERTPRREPRDVAPRSSPSHSPSIGG